MQNLDPDRTLDVIISIDVAKSMTAQEFIDIFAEDLVKAQPIPFEKLDAQLKLSERRVYIRAKNLPEFKPGTDIIEKRAKLTIGC